MMILHNNYNNTNANNNINNADTNWSSMFEFESMNDATVYCHSELTLRWIPSTNMMITQQNLMKQQ